MVAGISSLRAGPDLASEWRARYRQLELEMKDRTWCERVAGQTENQASPLTSTDRDPLEVVLRRSRALLDHFSEKDSAIDLNTERQELEALAVKASKVPSEQGKLRYSLYEDVCQVRRSERAIECFSVLINRTLFMP